MVPGPTARPVAERFWEKVDKSGPLIDSKPELGPCYLWIGTMNGNGYGVLGVGSRIDKSMRNKYAHRLAWELAFGELPEESELDHLCHTHNSQCQEGKNCPHRKCVNVNHLEIVTTEENFARGRNFMALNSQKTHCKNGHEFRLRILGTAVMVLEAEDSAVLVIESQLQDLENNSAQIQ